MKFKARIERARFLSFLNIIQALGKLSSTFLLQLRKNCVKMVIVNTMDEVQLFVELPTNSSGIFQEYRIERKPSDTISLQIGTGVLLKAFRSGAEAPQITLKLTKRQGFPCLTLEIETVDMDVTQDVPVKIISNTHALTSHPKIKPPEIKAKVTHPRILRNVIERMKNIDKFLHIAAGKDNTLIFKVETMSVSIKTFFRHVDIHADSLLDDGVMIDAKVDIKRFHDVLFASSFTPQYVWCLISADEAVVLYFVLDKDIGKLTYYLPSLSTD